MYLYPILLEKGSSRPLHHIVGSVHIKQIYEIAKIKQKDEHLSHFPLQSLCRMIIGSCQSIGLKVEGLKEPRPRVDYM